MMVPGAVVWFDEAVENLACRHGVLSAEDREFRETIAAIMIADTHPELEDPDNVRENDITAEPVHLFVSEVVLGMLLQSGIIRVGLRRVRLPRGSSAISVSRLHSQKSPECRSRLRTGICRWQRPRP